MEPKQQANEELFLSQLLGGPIQDDHGASIAELVDLVVRVGQDQFPPLIGLVARTGRRDFFLPINDIKTLTPSAVVLATVRIIFQPFQRRDNEMLLKADLLDKRAVDLRHNKVVRVNDLVVRKTGEVYRLMAVDASNTALLRRLGLLSLFRFVARHFHVPALDRQIPWTEVDHFASEVPQVRLAVSHSRVAKLHPADIAQLVAELPHRQGNELMESFDHRLAADVLEEMEEEDQADYLTEIHPQRAASILNEMSPDEAADLLAGLPNETTEELLQLMSGPDSNSVEQLLSYPEHTAGGIMTTDFVAVPEGLTAGDAIRYIRHLPDKPEFILYVYVVADEGGPLVGVIDLTRLLLADPYVRLSDIMDPNLITARPDDEEEDIARTMARYNMLALPVIDEQGRLLGIVTVDDVLDVILPQGWKKRIPKIFK